ncbi:RNA-directed DNA polymerase, eukaryota, reverse transcriptase zinc-binding domain protein [Tanacetum coccineum]
MNQTPKQKEVRQVIYENNLCLCAILESHVANSNLQGMCSKIFKNWHWTSNGLSCVKGSRIILGWNPNIVKVVVISFDAQVMHTSIYFKDDKKELFCSFVYAHNRYLQRRDLWCNLITHKAYIRNRPWCILGDFNVSLSADEKSTGTSYIDTGMRDFQECVEDLELSDVNSTGLRFTWNQKPKGDDGILKKIDRIMANLEFYESFVGSSALFQPYRISDHSPAVLRIPMHSTRKPQPFKFYNLLVHNTRFKDVVTNGWQISVSGFWMFKVVKRLKLLKKPLRKLLYDQAQGGERRMLVRFWIPSMHEIGLDYGRVLHLTSFSLSINGISTYFKGISFTYHRYCSKLNIINLCFADDLFLFAHGDANSARVIMDSLEEFKNASGLTPYFSLTRLLYRDCSELIEKIKRRVSDWKNKSLSLAGRAQLIRSVLSSMHLYWASVFILPSSLMLELEQVMRGFLWCQGEMRKGKAKVAWEDVCLPKKEGGLGIRRLEAFNKALISSHIWSLLSHKESLWVKWIHTYKLNGRTFWEIPLRGKISWGWRKIPISDNIVSSFLFWYRLGNGAMTSAWFDNWCSIGPIEGVVSNRDIYSAGFRLNAKVRDIINNGSWGWPTQWNLKYHSLVNIVVPQLSNTADRIIWRYLVMLFASYVVWEHLKRFTGMANMPSALNLIVDFLIPLAKMRSARSVIAKLIQEDDECADVDSSLEVAYLACWSISELMSMLMDIKFSLVRVFGAGLKVECSSVAVLFFPSPRFFPLGFSWEGFLRRQDRLAVYTPMMLLRDDFEALFHVEWRLLDIVDVGLWMLHVVNFVQFLCLIDNRDITFPFRLETIEKLDVACNVL